MPTSTNINYEVNVDRQHYIVPCRKSLITLEDVGTAHAGGLTGLNSWLNTADALDGLKVVEATGSGSNFEILIGDSIKVVTNAELQSNVAKLTLSTAPGVTVGAKIRVRSLPAPFAGLNGTFTVTAVSSTAPFSVSYALTATNIAAAAVAAGSVITEAYQYPLDGTGKPIRLTNITGMPLSNNTNTSTTMTEDAKTLGNVIPNALSNARSIALSGRVVLKDLSYKIAGVLDDYVVTEGLIVKYLRVGPRGETMRKFAYAMAHSQTEGGNAMEDLTYSMTLTVIGQMYTFNDNNL